MDSEAWLGGSAVSGRVEWKPVVGEFAGEPFEVSSLGWVRRSDDKSAVYVRFQSKGYVQARTSKLVYVHKLVAEAFHGLRPEGGQVNHINGCKSDNRASNLEWVTGLENIEHSSSTGLHPKAVAPETVAEVRRLFAAGTHPDVLVWLFGISRRHVYRLVNGTQRRLAVGFEDDVAAAKQRKAEERQRRIDEAEYRRLHPKKRGRPRKQLFAATA